ncbi:type II secretion system protein N [Parvibium lacunae]|nr:type II secretion system protein N [Parvibium lacunae]
MQPGLSLRMIVAALVVGCLLVLVPRFPARWIIPCLPLERVGLTLGEVRGTLWQGSAVLGWRPVAGQSWAYWPGRITWEWQSLWPPWQVAFHNAQWQGAIPLTWRYGQSPQLGAGRAALPAQWLNQLGAPWNTIQPAGELLLQWATLTLPVTPSAAPAPSVPATWRLEWQQAQAGMVNVGVLGSYVCQGEWPRPAFSCAGVTPLQPLQLQLSVQHDGTRWRWQGQATVAASQAAMMQGMLNFMGRRHPDDPNQVVIGN